MTKIRVYADTYFNLSEEVIKAYELMYKYGILKIQKDRGALEEYAIQYFYKIEQNLESILNYLLEKLAESFERWLAGLEVTKEEWENILWRDLFSKGAVEIRYEELFGDDAYRALLEKHGLKYDSEYITEFNDDARLEAFEEILEKERGMVWPQETIPVALSKAREALSNKNVSEKIAIFNYCLSIYHMNGTAAEFLDVDDSLLDDLSTGTYTENWDKDLKQMGVKTAKRVYANEQDLQLVFGDGLFEMDIVNNDPWALARLSDINIMAPNLLASYVDMNFSGVGDGVVVAAVFDEYHPSKYSFDVVVHPKYKGKGLGTKLIEIAMDKYKSDILEVDPETILELDVVNTRLVEFLRYKYHLEIKEQIGGHIIMGKMINV